MKAYVFTKKAELAAKIYAESEEEAREALATLGEGPWWVVNEDEPVLHKVQEDVGEALGL